MTPARRLWLSALLLTLAGCAAPEQPVVRESVQVAPESAQEEKTESLESARHGQRLRVLRVSERGQRLPLRAALRRREARGWGDPIAIRTEGEPADLLLEPGHYQLMVFASPGPFGFDVALPSGEQTARVRIFSAPGGHTVLLESWLWAGQRVTLLERQIMGFGWGPRPDPALTEPPPPNPEAIIQETLRRAQRALGSPPPPTPETNDINE